MKNIILSVLFSFCFLPLWGQKDFSQIDSLIKQLLPESSEVGISVYDLTAKKPLYDYRAEKLSRPASTMKLLTAITALSRPEADEPFRTEVWHVIRLDNTFFVFYQSVSVSVSTNLSVASIRLDRKSVV